VKVLVFHASLCEAAVIGLPVTSSENLPQL